MRTHTRSDTENEILEALRLLGGWATVKEIGDKAGYTYEWARTCLIAMREDGTIQASKTQPILYSFPDGPLAKLETMEATPAGVTKLAKILSHIHGQDFDPLLKHISRRGGKARLSNKNLARLLQISGYKLMLVPGDKDGH